MSEKSKARIKLESEATELNLEFTDDTSSKDLASAIREAKANAGGGDTPPAKQPKARKTAAPELEVFEVIDRVRHNGDLYEVGDPIELDVNTELPALIAAGCVADPDEE